MKVCILMARGVEGCGVTKFTVEQMDWFIKNGHDVKVVSSADKKYTRHSAHVLQNHIALKFAKDYDQLVKEVNDCEILIINSVPANNFPQEAIDSYLKMLDNISNKVRVVTYQHDHRAASLRRNAGLFETIQRSDILFSHSPQGDFDQKIMKEAFPNTLDALFGDDPKIEPPVYNFQPSMNLQVIRDKFWKPVSEINTDIHRWIGRTTSWKGYDLMIPFHDSHLEPAGKTTILEGIEKSPAFIVVKEKYKIQVHKDTTTIDIAPGQCSQIAGPYINSQMLERMSRSGFGYQLSKLPPQYMYRSLEYTHLELACSGTIPVFHRIQGNQLRHRVEDKKLTEYDSGIIWLDNDNKDEVLEQIKELSSNKALYDKTREKAYEFIHYHQDSEYCFKEQFDIMTK